MMIEAIGIQLVFIDPGFRVGARNDREMGEEGIIT